MRSFLYQINRLFFLAFLFNISSISLFLYKQQPDVFYGKGVLEDFAKFTGKHLCQSIFFNKAACVMPATL